MKSHVRSFIIFILWRQCYSLVSSRAKRAPRGLTRKSSFGFPQPLAIAVPKEQHQRINKKTVPKTHQEEATGVASTPSKELLSASLLKSIVGGGILAVPAAIASLDAGDLSIPTALVLTAVVASMYGYTFTLLGKVCEETGASSYTEAWEKTMGPEWSPVVSAILSLKTTMACVAYSMILADSVQTFSHLSRLDSLLGVTVAGLLPLCLLPDLTSLAPFSLAGILGFVLTAAGMLVRLLDGSYAYTAPPPVPSIVIDGAMVVDMPPVVEFPELPLIQTGGDPHLDVVLQVMGMMCTLAGAFVAHYNAPRLYKELAATGQQAFDHVTKVAFTLAALLTAFVGVVGFQTFGAESASVILANYAENDIMMMVCKFIITVSLVFTFPLPFVGLRDSLQDRFQMDSQILSIMLLTIITIAAATFHDLGMFLQVGGGTVSTTVAAVLPTLMYKQTDNSPDSFVLPTLVMWVSVAVGATGVCQALWHAYNG